VNGMNGMSTVSTLTYAVGDSLTMLRRQLRHARRYPELTLFIVALPVVFLLLFVYVFGGTLGAGLGPSASVGPGDRADYVNYVVPGIMIMTLAAVATGTATSVAMDMTQGIIDRFRTLSIAPTSVLTGHVLGSVLQSLAGMAVVLGIALASGFRPSAGLLGWLGAIGLLTLAALAVSWLSVACGLVARSVESASNLPIPLILLPFLGSGFVPTESMPAGLSWFAEHQPFTPIMDTLRALLLGTPIDRGVAWLAVGWCLALGVAGYLWARRAYFRPRQG
jgi:ABC-2 type transport system permease protein